MFVGWTILFLFIVITQDQHGLVDAVAAGGALESIRTSRYRTRGQYYKKSQSRMVTCGLLRVPRGGVTATTAASAFSTLTSSSCKNLTSSISSPVDVVDVKVNVNESRNANVAALPPAPAAKKLVSALVDGLRSGLASGAAAGCAKTLLQPLDAIKTLQQSEASSLSSLGKRSSLSTIQAARRLFQKPGGIANFYAGLGVSVVGSMPSVALYFGVYQFCKNKLLLETDFGPKHKRLSIAISAAIGNTIASASRTPCEVVKQKLQMGTYPTLTAAIQDVLTHPLQALFPKGGIATQMIRDIPYAVATLLLYESLQDALRSRHHRDGGGRKKKQWDFVIGGLAGGFGSWITNPLDVIKTRLQTDVTNRYGGSVWTCASLLWAEGGPSVFMRGAVPRLMHKVPANCFFFLFYEMFRRILSLHSPPPTQHNKSARTSVEGGEKQDIQQQ